MRSHWTDIRCHVTADVLFVAEFAHKLPGYDDQQGEATSAPHNLPSAT